MPDGAGDREGRRWSSPWSRWGYLCSLSIVIVRDNHRRQDGAHLYVVGFIAQFERQRLGGGVSSAARSLQCPKTRPSESMVLHSWSVLEIQKKIFKLGLDGRDSWSWHVRQLLYILRLICILERITSDQHHLFSSDHRKCDGLIAKMLFNTIWFLKKGWTSKGSQTEKNRVKTDCIKNPTIKMKTYFQMSN
jgi:hypothetical protein